MSVYSIVKEEKNKIILDFFVRESFLQFFSQYYIGRIIDWRKIMEEFITASDSGKNGILIEYLTNIGSGNARVYSSWTSSYVPMKPYGGDATWHAGDYYVMP
jgi:hypothetical protein